MYLSHAGQSNQRLSISFNWGNQSSHRNKMGLRNVSVNLQTASDVVNEPDVGGCEQVKEESFKLPFPAWWRLNIENEGF